MAVADKPRKTDEERLAELGYKQELDRSWSGFQNFAISFTIISVLAGCFTTYYQAWNNGGPVAISWGWPIISAFILIIAFCMAELVSAMPTAGGIYWWSARLGNAAWAWFTGWFNLLGLIAIVASVDYFAGAFIASLLGLYDVNFIANFGDDQHLLRETFLIFAILLTLHAFINIMGSHLVARINGISVWWHVLGVAVIVAILVFVPDDHASVDFVFTERLNNSGFGDSMFWWYVLPLGFLLTQYTITGYDASAHLSEETHGAENAAPRGVWQSVFYSAVIGYIVLLAITFAASDPAAVTEGGGASIAVFQSAMGDGGWTKSVILIAAVGQFFCGLACMTSASRMMYAFSRDGAVPGNRLWSKVNQRRIPFNAVMAVAAAALILTLPALKGNKDGITVAFTAVVSIGVIGLYVAYVIPIWLRWRMGDRFEPGPWTLGAKYKWMCLVSIIEVLVIVVVFFNLPFSSGGVPWEDDFEWSLFNYTPLVTGGVFIAVGIWWLVSARHWFKGPKRTVEELDKEIAV